MMKANNLFSGAFTLTMAAILWVSPLTNAWSARPLPETSQSTPAEKDDNCFDTESQRLFQQGMAAVDSQNFQKAYDYFWRASRLERNNPDILNMLAYTQRKLGNFNEAIRYYDMALKLRPHFPQAREYLGEAHIQAALEQIKILKSYGPQAEHELADLIESFRKAAESLPPY